MNMQDVYLFTASLGFVFTVVGAFVGHWGGGGDGHDADVGGNFEAGDHNLDIGHGDAHGTEHEVGGMPLLSPSVISCYVGCFGASGLVYQWLVGPEKTWVHAPLAAVTGLGLGFGVAFLIWTATRAFEANRIGRTSDALSSSAEVSLTVPKEGMGEVAYVSGKTRQTLPARSAVGLEHKTGESVKVVKVADGVAFVAPAGTPGETPGEVGRGDPVRRKA